MPDYLITIRVPARTPERAVSAGQALARRRKHAELHEVKAAEVVEAGWVQPVTPLVRHEGALARLEALAEGQS